MCFRSFRWAKSCRSCRRLAPTRWLDQSFGRIAVSSLRWYVRMWQANIVNNGTNCYCWNASHWHSEAAGMHYVTTFSLLFHFSAQLFSLDRVASAILSACPSVRPSAKLVISVKTADCTGFWTEATFNQCQIVLSGSSASLKWRLSAFFRPHVLSCQPSVIIKCYD